MKKLRSLFVGAVCAVLALATLAFSSCNGTSDSGSASDGGSASEEPAKATYTVTFETNGGSEIPSQQVEEGGHATKPETDPTKTDYVFSGWCKDKGMETAYDFETETIAANTTIYASWASATDTSVAVFYLNDDTDGVFAQKTFGNGSRISDPGTPSRDGYSFGGWFTEDGTEYTKSKKFTGNQNFYAKWQIVYSFEAEKTQLTGLTDDADIGLATEAGAKLGFNFSGSANGVNLIKSDAQASGGSYVSGLFYRGAYLQFEITSDKATEGTLRLVLSCEYADISLTSNTYKVEVNGTKLTYNDFSLGNGTAVSTDPGPRGGFKEVYIGNISLNEGVNVIKLTVNNAQTPAGDAGTVDAAAPCVDCIRIYSDAVLSMTTYENK